MIAIMSQTQYNSILPNLPSKVIVGTPLIAQDGRYAICHPFTDKDITALKVAGVTLCDVLPSDFILPIFSL